MLRAEHRARSTMQRSPHAPVTGVSHAVCRFPPAAWTDCVERGGSRDTPPDASSPVLLGPRGVVRHRDPRPAPPTASSPGGCRASTRRAYASARATRPTRRDLGRRAARRRTSRCRRRRCAPPFPLIVDAARLGPRQGRRRRSVERALAGYVVLSATRRAASISRAAAPASRAPDATLADPERVRRARLDRISPTPATRCATRSTWPACSPTRAGDPGRDRRHRRVVRRRPVDDPRRRCATASCCPTARSCRGRARAGSPWRSPRRRRSSRGRISPASLVPNGAHARLPRSTILRHARRRAEGVVERRRSTARARRRGYYAPPGADPERRLTGWNDARRRRASRTTAIRRRRRSSTRSRRYHSAYYIDDSDRRPRRSSSTTPGPTTSSRPTRALRFWLKTRAQHPDAEIARAVRRRLRPPAREPRLRRRQPRAEPRRRSSSRGI